MSHSGDTAENLHNLDDYDEEENRSVRKVEQEPDEQPEDEEPSVPVEDGVKRDEDGDLDDAEVMDLTWGVNRIIFAIGGVIPIFSGPKCLPPRLQAAVKWSWPVLAVLLVFSRVIRSVACSFGDPSYEQSTLLFVAILALVLQLRAIYIVNFTSLTTDIALLHKDVILTMSPNDPETSKRLTEKHHRYARKVGRWNGWPVLIVSMFLVGLLNFTKLVKFGESTDEEAKLELFDKCLDAVVYDFSPSLIVIYLAFTDLIYFCCVSGAFCMVAIALQLVKRHTDRLSIKFDLVPPPVKSGAMPPIQRTKSSSLTIPSTNPPRELPESLTSKSGTQHADDMNLFPSSETGSKRVDGRASAIALHRAHSHDVSKRNLGSKSRSKSLFYGDNGSTSSLVDVMGTSSSLVSSDIELIQTSSLKRNRSLDIGHGERASASTNMPLAFMRLRAVMDTITTFIQPVKGLVYLLLVFSFFGVAWGITFVVEWSEADKENKKSVALVCTFLFAPLCIALASIILMSSGFRLIRAERRLRTVMVKTATVATGLMLPSRIADNDTLAEDNTEDTDDNRVPRKIDHKQGIQEYGWLILNSMFATACLVGLAALVVIVRHPRCLTIPLGSRGEFTPLAVDTSECSGIDKLGYPIMSFFTLSSVAYLPLITNTILLGWKTVRKHRLMFLLLTVVPAFVGLFGALYYLTFEVMNAGWFLSGGTTAALILIAAKVLSVNLPPHLHKRYFAVAGVSMAFVLVFFHSYTTSVIPRYVQGEERTKLIYVLIVHPVFASTFVSVATGIGAIANDARGWTINNNHVLFIGARVPVSLLGRVLVYQLSNANAQVLTIFLLSMFEVLVHISTPMQRYALAYVLTMGDQKKAFEKMNKYRESKFHSDVVYLNMFIEMFSLVFGACLVLMLQSSRQDQVEWKGTLLPLVYQIIAEVLADVVSIYADRIYHE